MTTDQQRAQREAAINAAFEHARNSDETIAATADLTAAAQAVHASVEAVSEQRIRSAIDIRVNLRKVQAIADIDDFAAVGGINGVATGDVAEAFGIPEATANELLNKYSTAGGDPYASIVATGNRWVHRRFTT